jgi:hypothetical protein
MSERVELGALDVEHDQPERPVVAPACEAHAALGVPASSRSPCCSNTAWSSSSSGYAREALVGTPVGGYRLEAFDQGLTYARHPLAIFVANLSPAAGLGCRGASGETAGAIGRDVCLRDAGHLSSGSSQGARG